MKYGRKTQSIKRKRAIRKANRGVITKYINEVNELLHQEETDRDCLITIQGLLGEKREYIKRLDSEILEICEIKDIDKEINTRVLDINKKIHKATSEEQHLAVTSASQPEISVEPEHVEAQIQVQDESVVLNSSASQTSTERIEQNQVSQQHFVTKSKLPKLVLPKFKGDLTKFRSFWDSYDNAVHKNSSLSTIDKFNYLYSLLEGPALRSIQGLSLTEENYQSAKELLNQRFGNQQQVISAHMDELLKIPACTGNKSSQLRFVYDKISVRGLEALGVNSSQYGSSLIPIIMTKLPPKIRLQIARNTVNEVWNITDLLEVMRKKR